MINNKKNQFSSSKLFDDFWSIYKEKIQDRIQNIFVEFKDSKSQEILENEKKFTEVTINIFNRIINSSHKQIIILWDIDQTLAFNQVISETVYSYLRPSAPFLFDYFHTLSVDNSVNLRMGTNTQNSKSALDKRFSKNGDLAEIAAHFDQDLIFSTSISFDIIPQDFRGNIDDIIDDWEYFTAWFEGIINTAKMTRDRFNGMNRLSKIEMIRKLQILQHCSLNNNNAAIMAVDNLTDFPSDYLNKNNGYYGISLIV